MYNYNKNEFLKIIFIIWIVSDENQAICFKK
jgi:hypothetical protein